MPFIYPYPMSAAIPIHGRFDQPLTGALLAFMSMSLFSIQDALTKNLARDYSLLQILFVRSAVIIIPLLCVLLLRYGRNAFHTRRPFDHALRVAFNFAAFLSYYFAISRLELGQATAIVLSTPLFMTLLSGPLLGEPADARRKLITIIGFIGVLLVAQPDARQPDWPGLGAALVGAFMFALLWIQTRRMAATESTELMVFFAALTFLCITSGFMLFWWRPPAPGDWALLISVGVVSLGAQFCIVHACQFAAAYVIAPFEYVTILWALGLGWYFFNEQPTQLMLAGCGVIILSGLAIVYIEHRLQPTDNISR